ncbi:MAG: 4Fe-4S dicluster domain-containing protein, partial [Phycisphaerae bacterium]
TQAGVLLREPLPTLGDAKPEWLIVNALESELVQTVMYRTLSEHGPAVMAAAVRLAATLGARRACLVVDRKLGKRWPAGASPKTDTPPATARLRIVRLSAHYPAGATPLVIHSVTGREIPYLGRAADVGVFIIDPVALLHLGRAVDTSTPQTWQPVTVAGDAVQAPGCYRVPLGTPLAHIARKVGVTLSAAAPAIVGDLLSGGGLDWQTSPPSVLTKQDHTLIFQRPTLTVERLPVACIRCGECLDHCPVGLDPRAILDRVERRRLDQLAPLSPAACLDCGLCDFVCPSALPLMRAVQRARHHVHP